MESVFTHGSSYYTIVYAAKTDSFDDKLPLVQQMEIHIKFMELVHGLGSNSWLRPHQALNRMTPAKIDSIIQAIAHNYVMLHCQNIVALVYAAQP